MSRMPNLVRISICCQDRNGNLRKRAVSIDVREPFTLELEAPGYPEDGATFRSDITGRIYLAGKLFSSEGWRFGGNIFWRDYLFDVETAAELLAHAVDKGFQAVCVSEPLPLDDGKITVEQFKEAFSIQERTAP